MRRKARFTTALLMLIATSAIAQSIQTVAGGGPIGDGRKATEATLRTPRRLVFDAKGNYYIADTNNDRVAFVDNATGLIRTFAGGGTSGLVGDGGPATAATVSVPLGIALRKDGTLLIADNGGFIRRVLSDGTITTIAGGGRSTGDGVPALQATMCPTGLAVDANDNILFLDQCTPRLRKIDAQTGLVTTVTGQLESGFSGDGGPARDAMISAGGLDGGLTIDPAGNIYFTDFFNRRIRKISASTGIITTVVGGGDTAPANGIAATSALFDIPEDVTVEGPNLLVLGQGGTLYRVDAQNILNIISGRGNQTGEGIPATSARLSGPKGVTAGPGGDIYIAESQANRIRRIAAADGRMTTVAGTSAPKDDGVPALSTTLTTPNKIATANNGDLIIVDGGNFRIRRVSKATGLISAVGGTGISGGSPDGTPAINAAMSPQGVAVDAAGAIYFSEPSTVRRVDPQTGLLSTVAGQLGMTGFAGDGGPATSALLSRVAGIAFDAVGNLYLADNRSNRVRKVTAATGIITTVAGIGPVITAPGQTGSFSGDGGPATAAGLNGPQDVAVDVQGNVYIADQQNNRVRKVAFDTGIITTFAGGGTGGGMFDGRLATDVILFQPDSLALDPHGNLVILQFNGIVHRVDARTGTINRIAGTGFRGYSGDGGPATMATINLAALGVDVDQAGNIFISDTRNNRIRAIFACVNVNAPSLITPLDGATAVNSSPTLSWNSVDGALRYDVFLSTTNPPDLLVASDITVTSFTPANLTSGARYYWSVSAKGDPFCPSPSVTSSPVQSFVTDISCAPPAQFNLIAPADGALDVSSNLALTWSTAGGAGSYDVLLGPNNPPPVVTNTAATSFNATNLAPGTTYFWSIVARATCDRSLATATPVRSFRVGGGCPTPGAFTQIAPPDGAQNVSTTATIQWSSSPNASSYDLYLGTTNPPPIYLLDLSTTTISVSGFETGQTYYWRIVAKIACDAARSTSTPVGRFTIRGNCAIPRQTSITFAPPSSIGVGQTYVVAWQDAQELEADGFYVIERSATESFTTILDTQETTAISASFVATSPGMLFHRVRPVNRCPGSGTASTSAARAVNVVTASPNVIFTVQPEAVLTSLGEQLEDKRARFVLENIATDTVSVIVGRQEIDSPPFFSIIDPAGGDSTFVALEPGVPKELELRFSGPANDRPASYQGVIFLAALGKGLAITPYAFVNLRVGGGNAASPEFRSGGLSTEYTFFPGFAGDDSKRPPITIDIRNPGSTPMELGAEIGPEVWLSPESGWNATAIPPGATRSVKLFTRRSRAPHGSALPRYTYFTVRTKSGGTARLLVQDNDVPPTAAGRGSALDPSIRSLIIPEAFSATLNDGNRVFATIRLSNLGSESVNTDLFFTPAESDGFDATRVKRAAITVPPNDVVTLTDPLVQLWALPQPARGQIEVRAPQEKIGLLAVNAVVSQTASGGGSHSYTIPTLGRGEGARSGMGHAVAGLASDATNRAALVVAETSGADRVSVRVALLDSEGTTRGERVIDLPRYSMTEIEDVATALAGGSTLQGARLELTVTAGGGAVIGVVKLLARTTGGGATLLSRPIDATSSTQSFTHVGAGFSSPRNGLKPVPTWRRLWRSSLQTAPTRTFLLPAVFSGPSGSAQLQTTLGLYAAREATTFNLTYREGDSTRTATVNVAARKIVEYANVLQQLFGVASGEGSLLVESAGPSDVYARLTSVATGTSRVNVSQTLPVITGDSEFVTTPTSQRPLYLDGLEQSVDASRGTSWSLILNEITGRNTTVVVRLYEAGNRSAPIAQKEFPLAALQRLKLPSVFGALDLDSITRRKDRTNMLVSVVYKSGAGAATAIAMATDNRTGDSKSYILGPASSSSPFSVQRATAVAPAPVQRKRAVRH